ncbi:carboxymuconolactone decarboxylase family protein [Tateyamaria sp.]|uniref:carboxymuconolactone decarboxylase family protein n=1 Tax=Tateyamaria sp. TaxID=1929288 RepID=UPI003B2182F8
MSSKDNLNAAKTRLGAFAKATPALFEGFSKISKTATEQGSFSSAQKELMATAIAVSQGCEDCILYHIESAKRHGAHETALVEALEVAVEMGGGPAVMYAGKALDAFRDL